MYNDKLLQMNMFGGKPCSPGDFARDLAVPGVHGAPLDARRLQREINGIYDKCF